MVLVYLGSAWLLGICLAPLFQIPTELIGLAAVLPAAIVILWWRERPIRLLSACCLALLLGALRFNASIPRFDDHSLAHYNDTGWMLIKGIVVAEPDIRDRRTNLRVDAHQIQVEDQWQDVEGTVLVQASRYPRYAYGDELEISGLSESLPPRHAEMAKSIFSIVRWHYRAVSSYSPQIPIIHRAGGAVGDFHVLGCQLRVVAHHLQRFVP